MYFFNSIREFMAAPALMIGLVTLIGLLLQKKPVDRVIKGTSTAIVGFILLSMGADFLQEGALNDFSQLFRFAFRIHGVVPNMEAVSSFGLTRYAWEISLIMLLGMIADIVMARFGPFHYIFLTGHHTLYMACLLTIVLKECGLPEWELILSGSLLLGLLMAMMPALAQRGVERITGTNRIALGHFSTFGYLSAAITARLVHGRDRHEMRSTEEINFPAQLSFMRDTTVELFFVMTVMFLIVTGIAAGRAGFNDLAISYQTGGYHNWVIYSVIQGAKFSAAIYVILAGVRLVIAEIVPSFKGIARKVVPHALPAVDCPILFSYAPNAVMIGFLMSLLGGVLSMIVLMQINIRLGYEAFYVIVPGVVAHFFCGGTAGVFGNAEGGIKGCVTGAFVHGILITILSLMVIPVLGNLNMTGTTFSDTDFCLTGILLGNLAKVFPGHIISFLILAVYTAPILWVRIRSGGRDNHCI